MFENFPFGEPDEQTQRALAARQKIADKILPRSTDASQRVEICESRSSRAMTRLIKLGHYDRHFDLMKEIVLAKERYATRLEAILDQVEAHIQDAEG